MGYDYDLLVLGSGPAGQKAAVQAAKLGRKVAVVERRQLGGASVNRGTIPSKTLREAVVYLTGLSQRDVYGESYRLKEEITPQDLALRTRKVIEREIDIVHNQLARNHITVVQGRAKFVDTHTVAVSGSGGERRLTGEFVVVATGSRPAHPKDVAFDNKTILDSDGLLLLDRIPPTVLVVGAGVIGIEYASMFAALGAKVTLVERRPRLLEFCDGEIVEGLQYHLRELGVTFRLGETVVAVERRNGATVTRLESGKLIPAALVLYSAGRQGATADLALENAGLEADDRGRIDVDDDLRTAVPHIFAAGDVLRSPGLAATAMEQGRLAACRAFDHPADPLSELIPIGIYTIPEISFVGKTEEQLTEEAVGYEEGIARYRELARGQILGDSHGLLKLLVALDDHRILGVHVLGTGATELVHIGQAVMAAQGTVHQLVDSVFNYPTLAEGYKVAALDATNKLSTLERVAR